ncbi:RNA-directed DNA polymerase (reverse transcriptase)-related family protein [Rhynchospora pubera]|uniref:RNA-directed DNA polymerase (Reverse transcriptase)-related family protein n=1 Tax=Rhynchospora pubera TaxID=906938 RepID=A0AAV8E962_9POAL|nr:RNA-directed DNA polymerase (reverse transcriptase)-related family protein [Rhynchospora pubera]
MCQTIGTSVCHSISNRLRAPFLVLQYADDTLIFATIKDIVLGNGKTALFWYGNWGYGLLHFLTTLPKPLNPFVSVHKCATDPWSVFSAPFTSQIDSALQFLQAHCFLGNRSDQFRWKWDVSENFSVKSAYGMLISASKISFSCPFIWKMHLPPTIRVFALLLFHNRLLTQEALQKRQILFVQGCTLCDQTSLETADHLFCQCTFVKDLWCKVQAFFPSLPLLSFTEVWMLLLHALNATPADRQNLLAVVTVTTLWAIWLERNNRVFRGDRRGADSIMHWIVSQQTLFLKYC